MAANADLERVIKELQNCQKQGTHEYPGKGVKPFKRRRAAKYKCGTVLFHTRRVLCDDCCKSVLLWLSAFEP
jgi:hypothetical protein